MHQHISTFFMSKLDSMATEVVRDTRLHYQFAVLRIPVIKGNLGDTAELFLSGEDKPQAIEPHHPNGIVEKLKQHGCSMAHRGSNLGAESHVPSELKYSNIMKRSGEAGSATV